MTRRYSFRSPASGAGRKQTRSLTIIDALDNVIALRLKPGLRTFSLSAKVGRDSAG
jgi:hypothetical protein